MIPEFDFADIENGTPDVLAALSKAAREVGFLTVTNTPITPARMGLVLAMYRAFFELPDDQKQRVNMALTGANRGWGAPKSEQVDPDANPDYKEVFDSGFALPAGAEFSELAVYAPNRWPDLPEGFETVISAYYRDAMAVARVLLRGLAQALGQDDSFFDQHFDRPMALLRGNYYPERPHWAGEKDFGIAAHTDYGCLTLLGTDGVAGLEVLSVDDTWVPVSAKPGTFVINFGEMLEFWTEGQVKATLHRVKGTSETRISVPLFFNPNYETNVAPKGADPIIAGEHLGKRFAETYLHMKAS